MWILLGTVFVASLLGSLHCLGMCGPFALLAGSGGAQRAAAIVPTVAYSLGRLITYSLVGLIFGTLGLALNEGTAFASWQQSATYVAGGLMIVVGLVALARYAGLKVRLPAFATPLQRLLQVFFKRTVNMNPLPRALTIGALTTLMPCGWLYTFAIAAAGTGSPLLGMMLMIAFWAGTVPVMTALMLGFNKFGHTVQQRLPVVMAILVVAIGVFTMGYRAPIAIGAETNVVTGYEAVRTQIQSVDHGDLPCCQSQSTEAGAAID